MTCSDPWPQGRPAEDPCCRCSGLAPTWDAGQPLSKGGAAHHVKEVPPPHALWQEPLIRKAHHPVCVSAGNETVWKLHFWID